MNGKKHQLVSYCGQRTCGDAQWDVTVDAVTAQDWGLDHRANRKHLACFQLSSSSGKTRVECCSGVIVCKLVLEKAEEPEIKLPTSAGSSKKQESSRKTSISALLTRPKPLTVWITINCGKFWKRWEYQTSWPDSWETCMQVRKQQLELDMEQQTGSK